MAYKYHKSEEFRANIFLFAGYAFSTPIGIFIADLAMRKDGFTLRCFIFCIGLFSIGYLLINHSYNIMLGKDSKEDKKDD